LACTGRENLDPKQQRQINRPKIAGWFIFLFNLTIRATALMIKIACPNGLLSVCHFGRHIFLVEELNIVKGNLTLNTRHRKKWNFQAF